MRVLFISPVVPEPATDGGRQRVLHLLEALTEAHDVTFVGFTRGDAPARWTLADQFASPAVYVDMVEREVGDNSLSSIVDALKLSWFAQPDVLRRVTSTAFWSRLSTLPLDTFDVIHVETMGMLPFALAIKAHVPRIRVVLDLPDVASHFNARLLKPSVWLTPSGIQGLIDFARLSALEHRLMPQVDAIVTCSHVDARRLRTKTRPSQLRVLPNCTTTALASFAPSSGHELVFVGTMSYPPNEEGVLFFCEKVLPEIHARIPDVRLSIVGKTPSPTVRDLERRFGHVRVTGEVDDVRPYLERAAVAVVPLLSGGGTRLKILEAMAAGRAVVSTSVGAEGLELRQGQEVLLANSPSEFAQACVSLLRDGERRGLLERNGRRLVEQKYDWGVTRQGLKDLYGGFTSTAGPEPKTAPLATKA